MCNVSLHNGWKRNVFHSNSSLATLLTEKIAWARHCSLNGLNFVLQHVLMKREVRLRKPCQVGPTHLPAQSSSETSALAARVRPPSPPPSSSQAEAVRSRRRWQSPFIPGGCPIVCESQNPNSLHSFAFRVGSDIVASADFCPRSPCSERGAARNEMETQQSTLNR